MTGAPLLLANQASVVLGGRIDDARHPAVRRVADVLRNRSPRPRTVLIDDEENIAQAIRAGVRILAVYAAIGESETARRVQEASRSTELHLLDDEVMRMLFTGEKHARVFALARAPRAASWNDLAASGGDMLVLDGVRIPGNIGAIIRSASAFDAAGVILLDSGLRTIHDRRLIRASRGLSFTIPILIATRTELDAFLGAEGLPLAVMTADADAPLETIRQATGRVAILMGAERTGPSDELAARADHRYAVPMAAGVESLNVSVAAALALYERRRNT